MRKEGGLLHLLEFEKSLFLVFLLKEKLKMPTLP